MGRVKATKSNRLGGLWSFSGECERECECEGRGGEGSQSRATRR